MNRRRVEAHLTTHLGDVRIRGNAGEVWQHIQQARIELEDILIKNLGNKILTPWQRLVFWVMYEVCEHLHDKNAQIIHDVIEAAKSGEGETCQ